MKSWMILAIFSAISAALVAIFGKIGVSKVDTTLATSVRAIIMAILLFLTSLFLGKFSGLNTIDRNAFIFIFLAGVAGAVSWLFYFFALRSGEASGVAAIDRTSVIFVLILSVLFLGEKLTLKTGAGALLIALGAILMTWK